MRTFVASLCMLMPVAAMACPPITMTQTTLQEGIFQAADGKICEGDITYPVLASAHDLSAVNQTLRAAAEKQRCPGKQVTAISEQADEHHFSARVIADQHPIYTVASTSYYYPAGAAHGMHHTGYITLNKMTGKPFSYYEMVDTAQLPAINAYIRGQLASREESRDYIAFAGDVDRQYIGTTGCEGCAFGADADGVFVQFGLYDVAPYASGEMKIHLPQAFVPNEDLHHLYRRNG